MLKKTLLITLLTTFNILIVKTFKTPIFIKDVFIIHGFLALLNTIANIIQKKIQENNSKNIYGALAVNFLRATFAILFLISPTSSNLPNKIYIINFITCYIIYLFIGLWQNKKEPVKIKQKHNKYF